MATRTVALLAYDCTEVIDVTGPAEVFAVAFGMAGREACGICVVSVDGYDAVSGS